MYWSVKSLPDPQKVSFLQKKGHGNSVCTLVECFFFFGFSKLILVSNEIPVTVIESTSNLLSYFTSEKYKKKKKKCLRFI